MLLVVIALVVVSLVLVFVNGAFRKLRLKHEKALETIQTLRDKLESIRPAAQTSREREFVVRFAREFPHLSRELHSKVDPRNIPAELNKIMVRTFEPWGSMVLLRRRETTSDPRRGSKFVVAAPSSSDNKIDVGMEFPSDQGELGMVAENQQVMSRDDFSKLPQHVRSELKHHNIEGFDCDLVAPMVFDGNTLGLLAMSRPSLHSESAKAVLRLIAHIGAMALQHATAYGAMKSTAEIDGLTGIYNKTYTMTYLSEKIFESEKNSSEVSILLMDIDNFKNYNDVNGHDEGDRLLKKFVQVVAENTRENNVFGRYGGEEFLLIFPGTSSEQALKAAENILRHVATHDFPHREKQPLGILSFSGGVANYPRDGYGSTELIRAADKALYEAKRNGRNRVYPAASKQLGSHGRRITTYATADPFSDSR